MWKLLLLALVGFAAAEKIHFNGFKVLRATPTNEAQLDALKRLQALEMFDFWMEPTVVGKNVDIMTSPKQIMGLENILSLNHIKHTIMIGDVEELILKQIAVPPRAKGTGTKAMSWDSYHRISDIYEWVESLDTSYPNLCRVTSIGQSIEGRDMKVIVIGEGAGKPKIWVDAGIHAREWISPATITYIINELVVNNDANSKYTDMFEWHILVSHNPDGYEYSHTNNRMWRKNRKDNPGSCYGVDLNRNFGHHWNEGGSSTNPCSDTYMGTSAFSEPESDNVRQYVLANNQNMQAFLTVHSYSQMWLSPWGYTYNFPQDYDELMNMARAATNALTNVHGTRYQIGTSTELLYIASGGSDDWGKGGAGVKYSYTIELRDEGWYGFLLPADQIIPTGEETFAAFKAVADYLDALPKEM